MFDTNDIEGCHRLPSRYAPKPVIVRFAHRKMRDTAIENKRNITLDNLKSIDINNNVYVNENFAPYIKRLQYLARKLKRDHQISQISTTNGSTVKVKMKDENKWIKINHETDFIKFFPSFSFNE